MPQKFRICPLQGQTLKVRGVPIYLLPFTFSLYPITYTLSYLMIILSEMMHSWNIETSTGSLKFVNFAL